MEAAATLGEVAPQLPNYFGSRLRNNPAAVQTPLYANYSSAQTMTAGERRPYSQDCESLQAFYDPFRS